VLSFPFCHSRLAQGRVAAGNEQLRANRLPPVAVGLVQSVAEGQFLELAVDSSSTVSGSLRTSPPWPPAPSAAAPRQFADLLDQVWSAVNARRR